MNIKILIPMVTALSAVVMLSVGCASANMADAPSTQTQVDLTHGNYKIIKAGAVGHSYGFRFLLGIIPITAPSTAAARADLYGSVGQTVNGKSIALINVVEDRSTMWLLLFSIPKIVITGDVVEFAEETNPSASPSPLRPEVGK